MSARRCIVCGKPIPKKTDTVFFRKPIKATAPYRVGGVHFGYDAPGREGRAAGTREDNYFYLDELPQSKADVARFANGQIVSVRRCEDGIDQAGVWDGESYRDKYFHADACAIKQGYASAQTGARFTWKSRA